MELPVAGHLDAGEVDETSAGYFSRLEYAPAFVSVEPFDRADYRTGLSGRLPRHGLILSSVSRESLPLMPPTEPSPAELTLVRAVEDLLTVAPIELALTETMGIAVTTPRRRPHPGPFPRSPAFGRRRSAAGLAQSRHRGGPVSAGLCSASAARGCPGPPGRDRRGARWRRGCRRSAPLHPEP